MNKSTLVKLIGFNTILSVAGILIYSRGFLNITENKVLAAIITIILIMVFISVNFLILKPKRISVDISFDNIRNIKEVVQMLNRFTNHAICGSNCKMLLQQYQSFVKKKSVMLALSNHTSVYDNTNYEVEEAMCQNMIQTIRYITIIDSNSSAEETTIKNEINRIVKRNNILLNQYDTLLLEVSQAGDKNETVTNSLQALTDTLRDYRMAEIDINSATTDNQTW